VPAIIFFNDHVAELADVGGQSMYPYLNTGYNESQSKDICWINKWKPTENLQRGMIVAFW
jgi:inner membrane protease subunit 2